MKKEELSKLLHSLNIPVNEGITSMENQNQYPHIVYWPYIEEDVRASGDVYQNQVTYQISLFSRIPQSDKYKELRKKLREKGIQPQFFHEFIENDPVYSRTWHTYFSVDVLEEVD